RDRVLRWASVFALIGLALMVWGLLDPHAMPVLVGLTIGQAIGTVSFGLFLIVVAADLRLRRKLKDDAPESRP
ncbi:MAG: hypothetical protein ACXVEE_17395, partial [Polyangiales bacterium]